MNERTVAELLSEKNSSDRRVLKPWLFQKKKAAGSEHIYVFCSSRNIAKRFLRDAEDEGFTFHDGMGPTSGKPESLFALYEDYTVGYAGWAGHVLFHNHAGSALKVDYGKYISGNERYVIG